MILCIAEKPSVAKEIAKILGATSSRNGYMEGNGYWVSWTFGHLCTLQEPHDYEHYWKQWRLEVLPMIPQRFKIKVIDNPGVQRQFAVLEDLISKSTEVVNCGDAGQEGELIQRWVLTKAQCKVPVKRLWISSLTEEAIKEGFSKLMDAKEFDPLYAAGSARAIGDWLLGMNATRAYTVKYGTGKSVLSIGRVQTPTLALLVERQKTIENFKSEMYWELKTEYRTGIFSSTKGRFSTKEEAEEIVKQIAAIDLEITKVEKKKAKEHPPKLLDLTSLQVECNKKLSFSADHTLQVIQSLYEKKLTTYPRVDTNFLPNDVYKKVPDILKGLTPYRNFIEPILSGASIRKSPKVFNDKKITDHHAIIPTGQFTPNLSEDEKRVYDMVARRFIAVFYPDCEIANTTVMAKVSDFEFKATGKQILDPAWRVLYPKAPQKNVKVAIESKEEGVEDSEIKQGEENVLPNYKVGEKGPHTPDLQEKETQAPKYFTEADLLRAMETAGKQVEDEELRELMKENGIGRPSTRANIIETLLKRNYIRKDKKRLLATPTGVELIDTIENELLKSAELTGQWEKKLRMISDEKYSVNDFMIELKNMVAQLIEGVKRAQRKSIPIILLCMCWYLGVGTKIHAQNAPDPNDFTWWETLHGYDGTKSWTEYLKYSPGFFGPNALPVQEFYTGRIDSESKLTFATDAYFGHGDNTVDLYLKWYQTICDRVAVRLEMVAAEYYETTQEVRDARLSREWDGKGWAGGDLTLNFSFQILRGKKYAPDIVLSAGFKTASGNKRAEARYFDSPAYNFDINIGKVFKTNGFIEHIELGGTFGFLCWQTGYKSNPQNDAVIYGFRLDLMHKNFRWENQFGGYIGYKKNGDKPMIIRTRLLWQQKHLNYFVQYQHGIVDYPFEQIRLGLDWKFLKVFEKK